MGKRQQSREKIEKFKKFFFRNTNIHYVTDENLNIHFLRKWAN